MYFIIGGDGKEYGPVSGQDIAQWVKEGRLAVQSQAKGEGDAEFRTLEKFPEFAALFAPVALNMSGTPAPIAPLQSGPYAESAGASGGTLPDDYQVDIGGSIARGWELLKANFGTLFVAFLLVLVVVGVVAGIFGGLMALLVPKSLLHSAVFHVVENLVITAVLALVAGPLMAGLNWLFIRCHRGEAVNVGDVFAGFQKNYKDLVLGYFCVAFVTSLCLLPFTILNDTKLQPLSEQMGHASPAEVQQLLPQFWAVLFSMLPVLFICLLPTIYLSVNLLFTLPLIIDKNLAFWPAMKTSWTQVHKHWWQVCGLTLVVGLVSGAGILACCVGVLVTAPIGMIATMVAYETIFCSGKK